MFDSRRVRFRQGSGVKTIEQEMRRGLQFLVSGSLKINLYVKDYNMCFLSPCGGSIFTFIFQSNSKSVHKKSKFMVSIANKLHKCVKVMCGYC